MKHKDEIEEQVKEFKGTLSNLMLEINNSRKLEKGELISKTIHQ